MWRNHWSSTTKTVRISTNVSNRIQGLERLSEIHAQYLNAHPAARSVQLFKLVPHYLRVDEREKARRTFSRPRGFGS